MARRPISARPRAAPPRGGWWSSGSSGASWKSAATHSTPIRGGSGARKIKQERYPTDAAWRSALTEQGVSEQDVIDERLWQRILNYFIDSRFRSGVQVTDEEIRDYFEKTVKPLAEAAHPGQSASLDDYRSQIEETLAGRHADWKPISGWRKPARAPSLSTTTRHSNDRRRLMWLPAWFALAWPSFWLAGCWSSGVPGSANRCGAAL